MSIAMSPPVPLVYGVVTTGVYCRPGCPARAARAANRRWFADAAAARAAGFRACRRCRPDEPPRDAEPAVLRALKYLADHAGEPVTLATLAAAVGQSPFHLQRRFRRATGMSPKEYATALRLARFRRRTRAGEPVTAAMYAAGFGSSRGLYEAARGLGMTPGRYARRGAALRIQHACADSALGRVLIGWTDAGVCAVLLGRDDAELRAELRREFPAAETIAARGGPVAAVLAHLADTTLPLGVALDCHGTPFQIRVWQALRAIPPGERRSYAELAEQLGSRSAARAVGSACARNVIAVLIPCHRVVPAAGGTGGYRWGVARKQKLLAAEAARRR